MIRIDDLYSLMESSFDYLLVTDESERIVHVSPILARDGLGDQTSFDNRTLADILAADSLATFHSAMAQARAGSRAIAVLAPACEGTRPLPLRAGYGKTDSGGVYLFFGNKLNALRSPQEWEKVERVKELTCLYDVAEWIEVSGSISEFFAELPRYLAPGMLYPDEAVVYSTYQGIEYGQRPSSNNYLSVHLVIGDRDKGEIRVGYHDEKRKLLPEEQRMLDEIARMLNLALDRKELKENLAARQHEEAEYKKHLEELEREIAERTRQVEEQKQKLQVVNSYLDRVKGGWEESRATLEAMFKAIPDDVVLIDPRHKVVMTNRSDISPGTFCYASFFGRERPCEDCRLARIMREKAPVTLTMKLDNKFLEVHALPVYNKDHEVEGITEYYRDVTLEKTFEQQLQQADKLASLGQLVSGIGHEINNPNQFIRGNVKILKQALEDMLPIMDEYQKAHPDLKVAKLNYDFFRKHIMTLIDDMDRGSTRIKGIVEGLRTFARKDEGLLVDTIEMNTLIEAGARLVKNEIHKHADIELDLADGLPALTGNAQKIEQVLVNLLVNAGQAMRDDVRGLIRVRTRAENGDLIFEVEDNGVGMNEKTIKQIFDPFFTTKRAKGGTGLGLAIVYRIVEEHSGTITVKSKLGAGTTFVVRFPAKAAARQGVPAGQKPAAQPPAKGSS